MGIKYDQAVKFPGSDIAAESRTIFDTESGEILFETESNVRPSIDITMHWENALDLDEILDVVNSFFGKHSAHFYQFNKGKIYVKSQDTTNDSGLFLPIPLITSLKRYHVDQLSQNTLETASCDLCIDMGKYEFFIDITGWSDYNRGINVLYHQEVHNSLITDFFKATGPLQHYFPEEQKEIILAFQDHVKP